MDKTKDNKNSITSIFSDSHKKPHNIVKKMRKFDFKKFNSALFAVPFGIITATIIAFSAYHVVYAKKIIPGVHIANVNVGGLDAQQAYDKVLNAQQNSQQELTLKYDGTEYKVAADQLGINYNTLDVVKRAFEIGRTQNFYIDTKDKVAGLVKPLNLKYFMSFDEAKLNQQLTLLRTQINIPHQNAFFKLNEQGVEIVPAFVGNKIVNQSLYDNVITSFENLEFSPKNIETENDLPSITENDLAQVETTVVSLVNNPMSVNYDEQTWELSREQVLDFITVKKMPNGDLELSLDKIDFESYAQTIALEVNNLPRGRITQYENDRVIGFELTTEGTEVDADAFADDFEVGLLSNAAQVQVPIKTVSGPSDPAKYGIYTLIGEGNSTYAGSATARINNLILAAERTNGVLVAPGEVYSFNNSVGEISGATGYDTAYIISNGRTVLGEGGGVCQTSTTMFRAALNTGLPIVTRHPHAYRVVYYEQDQPVGIDAAIYQPSLDFKFKNDTPNYILIETEADRENTSLAFKIYGTPDGRQVEITEPVVSGVVPPPEALYQDDDSLPKGTVRQVDFAAWGATSSFNRTVRKDGEVMHSDTFTSRYQPWRAVFLRGTRE